MAISIHEKDVNSDPLNYRSVNLTSVIPKIMECLIAKKLMNYLEESNILSAFQFAFWVFKICSGSTFTYLQLH